MAVTGAKTIAEYAIRRWMEAQNFSMGEFVLLMDKNEGTLTDRNGESMVLVYDAFSRSVYIKGT